MWKAGHIILFLPQPSLIDWAFCIGEKMKHYKNWGTVSSGAELYMLNHAERHRKELERESARRYQNTGNYHRQRPRVLQHGKG